MKKGKFGIYPKFKTYLTENCTDRKQYCSHFQAKLCPFRQFMHSKPDKYGQKFWLTVDLKTKYLLNAFPYLGKDEE